MTRSMFGSAAIVLAILAPAGVSADIWTPSGRFARSEPRDRDETGTAVVFDGARVLAGAPRIDDVVQDGGGVLVLEQIAGDWREADLLAPDTLAPGDRFGNALALDGDVLVVGARFDDTNGPEAGAAYVFRRRGDGWIEEAKLIAPDGRPRDHFGWVVDVSGDTIVVGAPCQGNQVFEGGAAYAFGHDGTAWAHHATFRPTDAGDGVMTEDWFGDTVAIDGPLVLIGAPRSDRSLWNGGAVHPYRLDGATWIAEPPLLSPASDRWDWFGVAIAIDGETAVIGADGAGATGLAWVYHRVGGAWSLAQTLEPSGLDDDTRFGDTLALRNGVLAIAAPYQGPPRNGGIIRMYAEADGTWWPVDSVDSALTGMEDDFGNAMALAPDGRLAVGIRMVDLDEARPNVGAVEVWDRVVGRRFDAPLVQAPPALERAQPPRTGDMRGWRIAPEPALEGYTDRTSYAPGGSIGIHVSSPTPTFDLVIYREAGYEEEVVLTLEDVPGAPQVIPPDAWRGAHWSETVRVAVGDWPSGLYAARFTNDLGMVGHHPFVIRPTDPGSSSRIVFLANFFNRNAYNRWGGKSVYGSDIPGDTERARRVSFRRPYKLELGRGEDWPWVHRLQAELASMGYVLEHLTERDVHDDPCLLRHYDVVLMGGHNEYPTARVYDALQAHHERGGHLCDLSSDGISWQARFEQGGDLLVCFRSQAESLDPMRDVNPCLTTTRWWREIVNRPEERLRGSRMQDFSNALGWLEDYIVQDASHWAFEGTSAVNGLPFGTLLAHDEQDWLTAESPNVDVLLYALKDDHANKEITRRSLDEVATGAVFYADTPEYGFADGRGGMVFTAGTMHGWIDGLVESAPGSADVRRFTRNVLDRMLARPAPRECVVPEVWCPMPIDVDGDGIVGIADLLELLESWGPCEACPADFDVDGIVDIRDLLTLLAAWS